MKKLSLLLFLLTLPAALSAQEETARSRRQELFVPQHELRLTAGAYPILPFWIDLGCDGELPFPNRTHRGPVYTGGAWSLSYDYRFRKWFDLGLTLGYYSEYSRSYSNRDASPVGRNRAHALTVMPAVRFTWMNRRWVRMYSSLGLGATFVFGHRDRNTDCFREGHAAFQFTPVGISVGRSLFGFAEVGVGAQGTLMMGIGYKFKPKNRLAE